MTIELVVFSIGNLPFSVYFGSFYSRTEPIPTMMSIEKLFSFCLTIIMNFVKVHIVIWIQPEKIKIFFYLNIPMIGNYGGSNAN